ncbi:MAG: hypothetical protein OSB70_06345 [Myxococcota bacterium]|nr:hypothetical protein [Myxococcota bacterium]
MNGQGISQPQSESGDRAIRVLLADPAVREQVNLVITYRQGPEGEPKSGRYAVWGHGIFAFTTPAEVPSHAIQLEIKPEGFNPRRLTLAGESLD